MVNSDLCQINRPYFGRKIAFRLERDHAYLRLFWSLDERKEAYTREASSVFTGRVYVPDDLERISLE